MKFLSEESNKSFPFSFFIVFIVIQITIINCITTMKNIELAKNYCRIYHVSDNKYKLINLFPYQEDILTTLETNRFVKALASRQMGLTQMLSIHGANFLINNKTDRKILFILSSKVDSSREILNRIRQILNTYKESNSISYGTNSANEISILQNGNTIKIISNINGVLTKEAEERLNKEAEYGRIQSIEMVNNNKPYGVLIDNAAFIRDFNYLRNFFELYTNVQQIVIFSSFRNEINGFYDEFYLEDDSYKRLLYKWDLRFNSDWYNLMKSNYGNKSMFEIDLEQKDVIIINKSHTLTIRVDHDLYEDIGKILIKKDIKLSEYVRNLIQKDIYNGKDT